MKTIQPLFALLVLVAAQAFCFNNSAPSTPDSPDPVITESPGDVSIGSVSQEASLVQSGPPESLETGSRDFYNGEMVQVTNGGKGTLSLNDGTELTLFNETQVSGVKTTTSPPETDLFLQSQGFLGYVPPGGNTTISMPNGAEIRILGTHFLVLYNEDSQTTTTGNFDGTVRVTPPGGSEQDLPPEYYVEIFEDGSLSEPQKLPFTPEQFEQTASESGTPITGLDTLIGGVPEKPTEPSSGGNLIAFSSRMNGNADIFLVDVNGDDLTQLTSSKRNDLYPSWSPDGKRIVYQTDEDGDQDIAIIDVSTQEVVILTPNTCYDWGPTWSPDGGWISFYSDCDGDRNIYKMRIDGSDRTQLTFFSGAETKFPSWSPDGRNITFTSNRSGKYHIYTMDADGNNIKELAAGCVSFYSPDGRQILYGEYCTDTGDIYLMNADGSKQFPLTDGYEIKNASWSPDGTRILIPFTKTDIDGQFAIFIMTLDHPEKSNWNRIISYDVNGRSPVWQP